MQFFPPLVQVGIASSKGVWGRPSKCRLLDVKRGVKPIAVQNFESKYQGITWNNHPPCRNFGKPLKNPSLNSPRHAPGPGGCFSCQKGQGCLWNRHVYNISEWYYIHITYIYIYIYIYLHNNIIYHIIYNLYNIILSSIPVCEHQ